MSGFGVGCVFSSRQVECDIGEVTGFLLASIYIFRS